MNKIIKRIIRSLRDILRERFGIIILRKSEYDSLIGSKKNLDILLDKPYSDEALQIKMMYRLFKETDSLFMEGSGECYQTKGFIFVASNCPEA